MKAFSNLLADLILTSSRNRKLSLLVDYFKSTPDPDRGYTLAALTGSLNFKNIKASFFKEIIKERQDEYLFDLSYDYVGDLAETVSLLWDQKKEGDMPSITSLFKSLTTAKSEEPMVKVLNMNVNPDNPRNGFFELDWNDEFVNMLTQHGYTGESQEEIVDKWFQTLCRTIGNEQGIDVTGSGYVQVNRTPDGKTEVS